MKKLNIAIAAASAMLLSSGVMADDAYKVEKVDCGDQAELPAQNARGSQCPRFFSRPPPLCPKP